MMVVTSGIGFIAEMLQGAWETHGGWKGRHMERSLQSIQNIWNNWQKVISHRKMVLKSEHMKFERNMAEES